MEAQEEVATKQLATATMIKGKRTKRQRASPVISHPSHVLSLGTSSSENGVVSTTSSSNENHAISANSTTEEEHDMAHCLILLAHGRHVATAEQQQMETRHVAEYQCKTCDRRFPSFQALGGHRASHKKPKVNNTTSANTASFGESLFAASTSLSLQVRGIIGNVKGNSVRVSKVHECSICGAEFTSGQALGGHMRRHRATSFMNPTAAISTSSDRSHESRNILELDLNLPAPEERSTNFPFTNRNSEQVIVFSSSPLVDCHY